VDIGLLIEGAKWLGLGLSEAIRRKVANDAIVGVIDATTKGTTTRVRKALLRARSRIDEQSGGIPFSEHTLRGLDRAEGEESLLLSPLAAVIRQGRLPTEGEIQGHVQAAWTRRRQAAAADMHDLFTATSVEANPTLRQFGNAVYAELVKLYPDLANVAQTIAAQRQINGSGTPDPVAEDLFRRWLAVRVESFYVPALRINLSSEYAFSKVVARLQDAGDGSDADEDDEWFGRAERTATFENELERYHDPVVRRWRRELDASELLIRFRRVVFIGGPGSGKSTLARKLAHRELQAGRTVFFVQLKTFRDVPSDELFDHAMRRIATEGSRTASAVAPQTLVLDGLDECEPHRVDVAQKLVSWSLDHPEVRIAVTTRRTGHDSALLPGFVEADLPHLEAGELESVAQPMVEGITETPDARDRLLSRVVSVVGSDEVAEAVALRNPLLLSYIISLVQNGVAISKTRAGLYEQILDAIQNGRPAGRRLTTIDAGTARAVAQALALSFIENPSAGSHDLIARVARTLETSMTSIEDAIGFWEERRLLERISIGPREAFTFVHLTLAEYLAGVEIRDMNDGRLLSWTAANRMRPKWREPIVLAGGTRDHVDRVVVALLTSGDPGDPPNVAARLATACVVETGAASEVVLRDLLQVLIDRLQSNVRAIALEAAQDLLALTHVAAAIVQPEVENLLAHPFHWTRIAATALAASLRSPYISADQAREFFGSVYAAPARIATRGTGKVLELSSPALPRAGELWPNAAPWAARVLLSSTSDGETRTFVEERLHDDAVDFDLLDELLHDVAPTVAQRARKQHENRDASLRRIHGADSFEKAFLEWISQLIAVDAPQLTNDAEGPAEGGELRLLDLSAIYAALGLGHYTSGDMLRMAQRPVEASLVEVFRGVMIAADVNPEKLLHEIRRAIATLDDVDPHPILMFSSDVVRPADWSRAISAQLDADLLFSALEHPETIIVNAAAALIANLWSDALVPKVEAALASRKARSMNAAAWILTTRLAPNAAFVAIAKRLREESVAGCRYLHRYLAELHLKSGSSSRPAIEDLLFEGLKAVNSNAADGAAKAIRLLNLPPDPRRDAQVRDAFEHWKIASLRCYACGIALKGATCDKCRIVMPTPLRSILRELGRREILLDMTELRELMTSDGQHVAKTARTVARDLFRRDAALLGSVLKNIREAAVRGERSDDAVFLDTILRLEPQLLHATQDDLLVLAGIGPHRDALVAALPDGWADRDRAKAVGREALTADVDLRDLAVAALRAIEASR
jgi:hypothetical protein